MRCRHLSPRARVPTRPRRARAARSRDVKELPERAQARLERGHVDVLHRDARRERLHGCDARGLPEDHPLRLEPDGPERDVRRGARDGHDEI